MFQPQMKKQLTGAELFRPPTDASLAGVTGDEAIFCILGFSDTLTYLSVHVEGLLS